MQLLDLNEPEDNTKSCIRIVEGLPICKYKTSFIKNNSISDALFEQSAYEMTNYMAKQQCKTNISKIWEQFFSKLEWHSICTSCRKIQLSIVRKIVSEFKNQINNDKKYMELVHFSKNDLDQQQKTNVIKKPKISLQTPITTFNTNTNIFTLEHNESSKKIKSATIINEQQKNVKKRPIKEIIDLVDSETDNEEENCVSMSFPSEVLTVDLLSSQQPLDFQLQVKTDFHHEDKLDFQNEEETDSVKIHINSFVPLDIDLDNGWKLGYSSQDNQIIIIKLDKNQFCFISDPSENKPVYKLDSEGVSLVRRLAQAQFDSLVKAAKKEILPKSVIAPFAMPKQTNHHPFVKRLKKEKDAISSDIAKFTCNVGTKTDSKTIAFIEKLEKTVAFADPTINLQVLSESIEIAWSECFLCDVKNIFGQLLLISDSPKLITSQIAIKNHIQRQNITVLNNCKQEYNAIRHDINPWSIAYPLSVTSFLTRKTLDKIAFHGIWLKFSNELNQENKTHLESLFNSNSLDRPSVFALSIQDSRLKNSEKHKIVHQEVKKFVSGFENYKSRKSMHQVSDSFAFYIFQIQ